MSNERVYHGNVEEAAEAAKKISHLVDEVVGLKAALNEWKIEFDVFVNQDKSGKYVIDLSAKLGNGAGFSHTISNEEILYNYADIDVFVKLIAQRALMHLLMKSALNDLGPKLNRAMTNVMSLSSQKSSLL